MFSEILKARTALLHEIPKLRIMVVGDVMLDRYLSGDCDRISPEAPVPVIRLTRRSSNLGGASNVAHNLAKLGVSVEMAGVIGHDSSGEELVQACADAGIGTNCIQAIPRTMTITKTRLLAGEHQIARFDEELKLTLSTEESDLVLKRISEEVSEHRYQAVILSDYAKGVCTPYLCHRLISLCHEHQIPIYVDPKGTDYRKYSGATAVKPNQNEMTLLAQTEGWETGDLVGSAEMLRKMLGLEFVALTLGSKGMALIRAEGVEQFPTAAREVFDVSGCGDAVISALVAGLHGGLSLRDSIILGNLAAAQVAARVGCVPVERAELLLSVQKQTRTSGSAKLFSLEELIQVRAAWKTANQKVAFTNGFFDILDAGRVRLLEDSASKSDRLIVAINSDRSVERLKGSGRPLHNEAQRIEVLSALECVDAVVVFEEDTPMDLLSALRPDLLVKGGDYKKTDVLGAEFVESYGGHVMLIPIVESLGYSHPSEPIKNL